MRAKGPVLEEEVDGRLAQKVQDECSRHAEQHRSSPDLQDRLAHAQVTTLRGLRGYLRQERLADRLGQQHRGESKEQGSVCYGGNAGGIGQVRGKGDIEDGGSQRPDLRRAGWG